MKSRIRIMNAYDQLIEHLKELGKLRSIMWLLGWDERTQLPPKGAESRADQMALLAKLIHARITDKRVGEWLSDCEASNAMHEPEGDFAVNVRETRRNYDRAIKLPSEFVEEMTKTEVLSQHAWVEARKKSDFDEFAPWLSKILDLIKRQVEYLRDKGRGGDRAKRRIGDGAKRRKKIGILVAVAEGDGGWGGAEEVGERSGDGGGDYFADGVAEV